MYVYKAPARRLSGAGGDGGGHEGPPRRWAGRVWGRGRPRAGPSPDGPKWNGRRRGDEGHVHAPERVASRRTATADRRQTSRHFSRATTSGFPRTPETVSDTRHVTQEVGLALTTAAASGTDINDNLSMSTLRCSWLTLRSHDPSLLRVVRHGRVGRRSIT